MLRTFTLDTNCIIDVAENRPAAGAVRTLADAHAAGRADVAVVAMSASEKQQGGHYIRNFEEFRNRLVSLGLGQLKVILPMAYFDISFLDHCLLIDDAMVKLEHEIHLILFPTVQFLWQDYCRANSLDPPPNPPTGTWRNNKCDVQAICSHIHRKRDVFVTSDSNFHKKAALIALGAGRIEHPKSALFTFTRLVNLADRVESRINRIPLRPAPR
jgi:hypothetical protein